MNGDRGDPLPGDTESPASDAQRIESIFHDVLERPIAERAAFLSQAFGADTALRARVLRLLECSHQQRAILDLAPPGMLEADVALDPEPLPGQRIGPYELVRNLASGGMGTVWLARRADQQFDKQVALKLIKRGMDTEALLARFRTERQVLASLEHPNIARLLDGGVTDDGLPYLVMEYVDGLPIDQFSDANRLTVPERLQWFRILAAAVQFAHRNLVVHRDLKPSNILVSPAGELKLLDFGIAKVLHADGSLQASEITAPELRLMTPRYASPEQVRGERITTASDIYSLGVVLYELLSGREPYDLETRSRADYERAICEQEPPRPSAAVARGSSALDASLQPRTLTPQQVSAARRDEPGRLQRRLSGDLDMIVLKALRKEPERRYLTVEQFSEDVRRHLAHEPILARPDSWNYRARKWVARNTRLAVVVASAAAALIVATGVSIAFGRSEASLRHVAAENLRAAEAAELRANSARDAADAERDKAVAMTEFLIQAMQSQDPLESGCQDILVSEAMQQALATLNRGALGSEPATVATLLDAISVVLDHVGKSDTAEPLAIRALDIRRRLHNGDHLDVALSLNNVACCLRSLGRPAEALPLHEAAVDMCLRLHPGDHPRLGKFLGNLGLCLQSLGRATEALPRYEAALELQQRLFGGDHRNVALGLNNIGVCLESLGRPGDALPKHEAALQMYQRLFSGDHPGTAKALSNVAACLSALGRPLEALPRFEAALEMRQRLFRGDHPDLAKNLGNIAMCLQGVGRHGEALPQAEASLSMYQRLFKGDHPDVAKGLNLVARCQRELGRPAEALKLNEAALDMRRRVFRGDHPDVAMSLNSCAMCLQELGRSVEALPRFEEGLVVYQRLHPDDHPDVAKALNNLASCLHALGRPAEALPRYQAALAMHRRLLAGDHPDVANALNGIGLCLNAMDRTAEALEQYEAALTMSRRLFGGDHPAIANGLCNVAVCRLSLGRADEALPSLEAALAMRQRLLPAGHVEIEVARTYVGVALVEVHRYDEAEPMLLNGLAALDRKPGVRPSRKKRGWEALVKLYEARHAADPNGGHDANAAEWRAKLKGWRASTQAAGAE